MLKFAAAEWFRIKRYWLTWVLLGLWIVVLALQVNGKLNELARLETEAETGISEGGAELTPMQIEGNRFTIAQLLKDLRYPAFIGYAARLSTGFGWFLVILFTAVAGGEDFRRMLRSLLAQGVGRSDYVLARCLTLWLATGVGIAIVVVLAAVGGLYVHHQVTDDAISLEGLDEPLLVAVRAWLACLPFVIATFFWVVLARQAGPAMGVGIGLHAFEFLTGLVMPIFAIAFARGVQVPPIFLWEARLLSVTLGYNADIFLNWGSPFMNAILASGVMGLGLDGGTLLPTAPWRAVAFLAGYTVLFLAWAMWILHRRDVTYGS
jgi:ABC-type transport system involved in multi-copper enzyme maturation permease subunit